VPTVYENDTAGAFGRLALRLHEEAGVGETVEAVVQFALQAVNCSHAGLVLSHRGGRLETAAATDPIVEKAEQVQWETCEGPALASITDHDSILVADTARTELWPQWGPKVAALGLRSVLGIRLHTNGTTHGALELFSTEPGAFDAGDDAVAHILAQHASVAVATAKQEESLSQAVDARKVIGQAQGILMAHFDIDDEQAFAVLRRYSQHNNVKLRDVAQQLIATRRLPG